MDVKRETAKKCRIKDIINGRYIKREGWEPNYLETSIGKLSRINILGVIINSQEVLTIDDGTGQIQIRSFDEKITFSKNKIGDVVIIIGRPRVFNEQKYVVPEIIKKIENPKWIEYRLLELKQIPIIKPTIEKEETKSEVKEEPITIDIIDSLFQKITELDKGNGVRVDEIIKHFEPVSANKTINKLIEQGEIFEIKPGIIKTI